MRGLFVCVVALQQVVCGEQSTGGKAGLEAAQPCHLQMQVQLPCFCTALTQSALASMKQTLAAWRT